MDFTKLSKIDLIKKLKNADREIDRLKTLELELAQVFNTAADGMRIIDLNYNTLKVNKTFLKLSKMTQKETIGKKCYDVFKGPLCHTDNCPVTRIEGGKQRFELEVDKIRRDGGIVPCIVTATPFVDSAGSLIGIVEDFKDISDRKNAEEEIIQKNMELKNANITLKNVLAHIEEEKIILKENISLNLEKNVKPLLNKIKNKKCFSPNLIDLLETNINQLSSNFYHKMTNRNLRLSPTELNVCQLVRSGYQAKEIAAYMGIETSTVHVHKERIRRKLGLTNKPINLKTYLLEQFREEQAKTKI